MVNWEISPIQIEDTETPKMKVETIIKLKNLKMKQLGVINMIIGGEIPKEKRIKRTQKKKYRLSNITFGQEDGQHVQYPHNDALVISAHIQNFLVKRLLIDDRSTVNPLS